MPNSSLGPSKSVPDEQRLCVKDMGEMMNVFSQFSFNVSDKDKILRTLSRTDVFVSFGLTERILWSSWSHHQNLRLIIMSKSVADIARNYFYRIQPSEL